MSRWVLDASPLILLGKIDRLGILPALNNEIDVPVQVVEEIRAGSASDRARVWLEASSNKDVSIIREKPDPGILSLGLGSGETAVLSVCASSEAPCTAVLDDKSARNVAKCMGIPCLGTIGILLRAKRAGIVPCMGTDIRELQRIGANLSDALVREALKLAGEPQR